MAEFGAHPVSDRIVMMVCSDSGGGKTGQLATLANAGKKVRIFDFDNGLDILANYLNPDCVNNVSYMTFIDEPEKRQSAWGQFDNVIRNGWKDGDQNLGKLSDWDTDTYLVLDTATFAGKAAMRSILAQNGRKPTDQATLPDWGEAGRWMENKIAHLCSKALKCNVIINTHLRAEEDGLGRTKNYPAMVGGVLAKNVGAYCNNIVRYDVKVQGNKEIRTIRTQSDNSMALKTSAPDAVDIDHVFDLNDLVDKIRSSAHKKLQAKG